MAKINKIKIGKLLLFGLLIRLVLLIISNYHPDLLNHIDWGIRFLDLGPKKFYENIFWDVSWANQPFGSILLFALAAQIKNILFSFILFLNNTFSFFPSFVIPFLETNLHAWLVKLPFILSDIGIAYLIYKIIEHFSGNQYIFDFEGSNLEGVNKFNKSFNAKINMYTTYSNLSF